MKVFLNDMTPVLSLKQSGWRQFEVARDGWRGLINRLLLKWARPRLADSNC